MNGITANFHRSADLVKAWGEAVLPGGGTVAEALTVEGIPFWDVVSPSFAIAHVSRALSRPPREPAGKAFLRRIVRCAYRSGVDARIRAFAGDVGGGRWPDRPPFVFLGFSNYMYRETLQPVAARLSRRSDTPVVVLDDRFPSRRERIARARTALSLWEYRDGEAARVAREMRGRLESAAARIVSPAALPGIVRAGGMSWPDFRDSFHWLFRFCLPLLADQAAVALRVMRRHRPALLLSTDVNDPRNRVFCHAGKAAGVKTLEIQFALYDEQSIEWRFFVSDHLAATGESNLRVATDHGVPADRATVTGSPRYDDAAETREDFVREIRRSLGVPDGRKMVLFASHPYVYGFFGCPEIRRDMIRALLDAVRTREELCLIVKPHPTENPAELSKLSRGMRNVRLAEKTLDIRDLIRAADAFVSFASTSTFHALVMRKPAISLEFPGGNTCPLFERSGATLVAGSAEQVESLMESVRNGDIGERTASLEAARQELLGRWFHRLDGRAAERIERIVLDMAGGG
ncbi:MAG: CDP-glycerol glycerophosphotransferase family protein [Thermodesulfobacteriota bacterium]